MLSIQVLPTVSVYWLYSLHMLNLRTASAWLSIAACPSQSDFEMSQVFLLMSVGLRLCALRKQDLHLHFGY